MMSVGDPEMGVEYLPPCCALLMHRNYRVGSIYWLMLKHSQRLPNLEFQYLTFT